MKLKLLPKFIFSLCIVGLLLTASTSIFSYLTSKSYLEEIFSERVMTNSNAIATLLDPEEVKTVISEGGDETEEYKKLNNLFNELKKEGNITYLSLVVPHENSVTFYIDAFVEEMGDDPDASIPYGSDILYVDAANPDDPADLQKYYTTWNLFKVDKGLDKPVVTDNSYGYNYTGLSVVLDENGKAIAQVQYILDMSEVRTYLNSFLIKMIVISFAIIGLTIIVYIFFVRSMVTNPIGQLTEFTEEITSTNAFEGKRIDIETGDEIESLSQSFNFMLEELEEYIHNLAKITAEKERIGAELDVARHIQGSMLPCIFPAFPERHEFDIYATMTPAKEVGGDFYDFFLVDDDHLALVIADVSGKGVPAALFMMISKTLIKSATQNGLSPKEVLEKVNNQLCESNDAEMFVTVWLGIMEISTGKMKCANAGHEFPAIMHSGGDWELYKDRHGFVLAGMENSKYREYEIDLKQGDRIFVYTDGVAEATDINNNLYGTDRMIDALNRAKDKRCGELLKYIHEDIDTFVGEADQFDDITMLTLEITSPQYEKVLNVVPTSDKTGEVTEFIESILSENNFPFKTIAQVNVAVDELFSNIVLYSGASMATVKCLVENGEVIVEFSDNGKPYDPTAAPDPDTSLSAEDRNVGGLGIFMVKKTMDDISYEYKNKKNILTIRKGC